MLAYNTGGFAIKDINFSGNGAFTYEKSGVLFFADLSGNVKLPKIEIDRVEASGFGAAGISIGSWNGSTGYGEITVTNSEVHNNGLSGLSVYGFYASGFAPHSHENLYIGRVVARDNLGKAGRSHPSGNGIVISSVNRGVIERSIAFNNGANNTNCGGPVGIWAYRSNDILIQYNESHHNRTNSRCDGGGFDLDGGTTNSVMQYNYSHDNDGPGYILSQEAGVGEFSGNIVRYNISQNDARKNNNGGIALWNDYGILSSSQVYNNTIYIAPSGDTKPAGIIVAGGGQYVDNKIWNNVVVTSGQLTSVFSHSGYAGGVSFENNAYWSTGGAYSFYWAGVNYPSLSAWRVTRQETLNGLPVGHIAEPQLADAGGGTTLNDADRLASLVAYQLKSTSPLIDRGTAQSNSGISNLSARDYFGVTLAQGDSYDIGAAEFSSLSPPIEPPSAGLAVGSRVATTILTNVYSKTSNSSRRKGVQAAAAPGTILAGPVNGGGLIWWRVNFDSGADGWVISSNIEAR